MAIPFPTYPIDVSRALQLLREGTLDNAHAPLAWGSNFSYFMSITDGELEASVIYKPQRGERPLWDFPDGTLCKRETAAFEVSEALGWHIVPPTVLRAGPQGVGMVQLLIDHDPELHYFTFDESVRPQLERIALFDLFVNNADRKGGHCILDKLGCVWAIDHGICFHAQSKLRTVIWEFAGRSISAKLLSDLELVLQRLADGDLRTTLNNYLTAREVTALQMRGASLTDLGLFPNGDNGRQYPWPPI